MNSSLRFGTPVLAFLAVLIFSSACKEGTVLREPGKDEYRKRPGGGSGEEGNSSNSGGNNSRQNTNNSTNTNTQRNSARNQTEVRRLVERNQSQKIEKLELENESVLLIRDDRDEDRSEDFLDEIFESKAEENRAVRATPIDQQLTPHVNPQLTPQANTETSAVPPPPPPAHNDPTVDVQPIHAVPTPPTADSAQATAPDSQGDDFNDGLMDAISPGSQSSLQPSVPSPPIDSTVNSAENSETDSAINSPSSALPKAEDQENTNSSTVEVDESDYTILPTTVRAQEAIEASGLNQSSGRDKKFHLFVDLYSNSEDSTFKRTTFRTINDQPMRFYLSGEKFDHYTANETKLYEILSLEERNSGVIGKTLTIDQLKSAGTPQSGINWSFFLHIENPNDRRSSADLFFQGDIENISPLWSTGGRR